ncbi:Ribosome biogenesis regulatory -like protein [Trichinella pseudospiralis]|uniref:Ribosome biogenesis regulatory protein n=1 Tax=Trichinella pseudospiralis TaxID=6337 RepID=A0A0V0Y5W3_TRIPS|nr:Ribosome biogenesis regulatory -like protein [Trichinella pseudospiralis]
MEDRIVFASMIESSCDTGLNITRAVDPSIDLGNLLVDEQEPVDQHLMKENTEMAVMNKVRESVQLMANKLWELPTQRVQDAVVVEHQRQDYLVKSQ